jgi:quercetin dioxygenase-like cupin family protein
MQNAASECPSAPSRGQTIVHFLGNLLTFRAMTRDTDGSFTLTECLTAPGAGAPLHRQDDEEAFLVLCGRYEITINGETRICEAGDFAYVPPKAVHAFRNPDERPAKMLIVNLPGGMHEGFFMTVGDRVTEGDTAYQEMGPPDFGLLAQTAARFGIEILPPQAA